MLTCSRSRGSSPPADSLASLRLRSNAIITNAPMPPTAAIDPRPEARADGGSARKSSCAGSRPGGVVVWFVVESLGAATRDDKVLTAATREGEAFGEGEGDGCWNDNRDEARAAGEGGEEGEGEGEGEGGSGAGGGVGEADGEGGEAGEGEGEGEGEAALAVAAWWPLRR